jgi:hypothetical protein
MRTEFTNLDLDNVVRQRVVIPKANDTRLNREAARAELRTLISVGIAILSRSPDIAPGPQNVALEKIAAACVALQDALRDGRGAVLQRSGYREGIAHDNNGPETSAFSLLNQLCPRLDELWALATVPALPVRRGAPSDDRRMIFLEECARYFERWTCKKISASPGSRFSNFATEVFSVMEIDNAGDLSWQIKRLIEKRGANLNHTAISSGVTLNKVTGAITMNAAALAAGTIVSFVLTDTAIAATDQIVVSHESGGTLGAYSVNGRATGVGTGAIDIRNNTAGSLSEAIVLRFSIIKSANA